MLGHRAKIIAAGMLSLAVVSGAVAAAATNSVQHHRTPVRRASLGGALAKRKIREATHRAQVASAVAGYTYPEQGINVTAAAADGAQLASSSGITTSAQAVQSFQSYTGAENIFGPALSSGQWNATLATVTEVNPVTNGVTAGTPYQGWVVTGTGPEIYLGGPDSAPPAAGTTCQDVGIYDFTLNEWSEMLQSC